MLKFSIGIAVVVIAITVGLEMKTGLIKRQISMQFRAPKPGNVFALFPKLLMKSNQIPSQQIVDMIQPVPGSVVVEVGPGFGFGLAHLFAKYQPSRVHATELSTDFLQGLQTKFSDQIESGKLVLYNHDAKDLSFLMNDSVDVIYGLNVVYFLDPLVDYLKEFQRVLKPGGILVFGVSENAKKLDPEIFVNRDWSVVVEDMKAAGFSDAAMGGQNLFTSANAPSTGTTLTGSKPMSPQRFKE